MVVVQNAIKHSGDVGDCVREIKLLERERVGKRLVVRGGSRRSLGFRQSSFLSDQDSGESDGIWARVMSQTCASVDYRVIRWGTRVYHQIPHQSNTVGEKVAIQSQVKVDKFMLEWNGSKAFREDIKKEYCNHLTFASSPRMRNPGEKRFVAQESPAHVPIEIIKSVVDQMIEISYMVNPKNRI